MRVAGFWGGVIVLRMVRTSCWESQTLLALRNYALIFLVGKLFIYEEILAG